ncbi:MAG: cytochrome P450 [Myxococcales bacterium]|nr:cytochrome P450 [Myxococcales bacterium]
MLKYRDLPHRAGWPLLGDLPEFSRDPLGFLTRLHAEHGRVARLQVGPFKGVSINDPELTHQVLTKQHESVRKSMDTRWLSLVLGDGLVTSEGALWKRHRKALQPAFHNTKIRQYADIMDQRARELIGGWRPDVELDVHAEMNQLTLRVVAEALTGVDVSKYYDDIARPLDVVMRRFEEMLTSIVPMPPQVPTPANRRAAKAVKRLEEVLAEIIRERRRAPEGDDLLSELLRAEPAERFNDQELRDELLTLLIAGHETTALALTWALKLVSEHPDVERRLVEESREHPDVVRTTRELRLHEHVVNEAMRLYPPVWGIGRELIRDADIGGYHLPRGTQIYFSQWVTHRDPSYFERPLEFDPDRWEEPTHPRHAFFPFGAGPRVCVGLNFAMLEAVVILSRVIEAFHLELTRNQDIDLMPAVTLRPRHGLLVTPRKREVRQAA